MSKASKDQEVSERLPVARVAVDISLAHLDRPFDYLVPASMDATAVPGCRVRVRFAGQLVDGYLLDRVGDQRAPGPAGPPGAGDLARARAHARDLRPGPRGGGPVRGHAGRRAQAGHPAPPRHRGTRSPPASAARQDRREPAARRGPAGHGAGPGPSPAPGAGTPPGQAFLTALAEGRPVRAAWSALPGPEWPAEIAIAAATTAAAGAGVVIVVPDARDLARVDAALTAVNQGPGAARLPDRRPGPGRALPPLAGRAPRRGPGRGGHPGRDVRPGRSPGPGRAVGRRRRPARRAPGTLPERPGGARPARPPVRRGRPDRRVRPDRRADPAGRGRVGQAADWPAGGAAPGRAPGPGRAGRGRAGPGRRGHDRPPAQPGPAHRPHRAWPPGRSWFRCPGAGTWPPSPAAGAAPRPGAPRAAARCRSAARPRCPAAGGAAPWPRTGPARGADQAGCARWSPGRRGPRRNWAARFPGCRCAPRAASTCWPRYPPSPPWSSPLPGPSRWRRKVTPPRCSWTAGRCSAGPACAPPRRRCAGG